jgi:hypothetical protein
MTKSNANNPAAVVMIFGLDKDGDMEGPSFAEAWGNGSVPVGFLPYNTPVISGTCSSTFIAFSAAGSGLIASRDSGSPSSWSSNTQNSRGTVTITLAGLT